MVRHLKVVTNWTGERERETYNNSYIYILRFEQVVRHLQVVTDWNIIILLASTFPTPSYLTPPPSPPTTTIKTSSKTDSRAGSRIKRVREWLSLQNNTKHIVHGNWIIALIQFSSVQDRIYALGQAHTRSANPSLRNFPQCCLGV